MLQPPGHKDKQLKKTHTGEILVALTLLDTDGSSLTVFKDF